MYDNKRYLPFTLLLPYTCMNIYIYIYIYIFAETLQTLFPVQFLTDPPPPHQPQLQPIEHALPIPIIIIIATEHMLWFIF